MKAGDLVIDKAYNKMIEENKDLQIVAQPEIELKSISKDEIEFTFVLTLKPEVKLGKYTGLDVKKEDTSVSKKEVEEALQQLREKYSELTNKDGMSCRMLFLFLIFTVVI